MLSVSNLQVRAFLLFLSSRDNVYLGKIQMSFRAWYFLALFVRVTLDFRVYILPTTLLCLLDTQVL